MSREMTKRLSYRLTLISLFVLIILQVIISLTRETFHPVILVMELIPLGITIPGLLKTSTRAFQWLCFVVLFFLVQGILLSFTPDRVAAGILVTLICVILFFSAIIFIRQARRGQ